MNRHDYEALLVQRSDIYGRMSTLIGTAEAGRRDLSAQEAAEYDGLEAKYDRLTRQINDANITQSGHPLGGDGRIHRLGDDAEHGHSGLNRDQDVALRAIDGRDSIDSTSGDRLEKVIRRDRHGIDSRYIAAVSDPAYARAFMKKMTGIDGAEGILDQDEAEAMRVVGRSMQERGLAVGEGSTGGFAIPLDLDPTILLSNDGAVNPIREMASVTTITHTKWEGVSSAGVSFDFAAEAAEAPDKTPTLAQPTITPEKAQAFVPYSLEAEGDWEALYGELVRLFRDAKAVKEAEVFAVGKGTENIPQGLITGATKIVETGTKEVVKIADVYALQEALAPRWTPRATWLGTNKMANAVHKMVAVGDTTNAAIMSDDRTSILGKGFREVSTMSTKITTKTERVLAFGDIGAAYQIVDRVGMTAEIVPHLFGSNKRPTGQRGLYVYFRVGAKVILPEAIQVLAVKNE